MADLRVRTIDESELETVLAEDFEFDGTIEFSEPLLVKGRIAGELHTGSDLYVAATANLDADVEAARVSVKGSVRGDILASERIELFSGARIDGNIKTRDLIVQSGSHLTGTCKMDMDDTASSVSAENEHTPGESSSQDTQSLEQEDVHGETE